MGEDGIDLYIISSVLSYDFYRSSLHIKGKSKGRRDREKGKELGCTTVDLCLDVNK
jgi:hypothetical protein